MPLCVGPCTAPWWPQCQSLERQQGCPLTQEKMARWKREGQSKEETNGWSHWKRDQRKHCSLPSNICTPCKMPGYSRGTPQGEEEVAVWTTVGARGRASDLCTRCFGQSLPHKFSKRAPSNVFSQTCIALGLQEAFEIRGSDSSPKPFLHQANSTSFRRFSPTCTSLESRIRPTNLSRCSDAELVSTFFPRSTILSRCLHLTEEVHTLKCGN